VSRPRLLLCPQFTEIEWSIAPQLAEWADVATFDAPGVGDEPGPDDLGRSGLSREMVVKRAAEEVDRRGWDSFFVIGDAWGTATAVRLAVAKRDQVLGIALGHACADYAADGERPAVNAEVTAAMAQLLRSDHDSFVRYGLTQFTQGGFDEDTAARMVERFPSDVATAEVWEMLVSTPEPIGDLLADLEVPMLFAKHDGCLVFTPEGYEDLVGSFPDATTVSVKKAASASEEFAEAIRDFCERSSGRGPVTGAE
jgi:pimeloyl-ACP methyl ester carboxylesterase